MYLKNEIDDIDRVIAYTLTIAITVIFKDKTEFQCTHYNQKCHLQIFEDYYHFTHNGVVKRSLTPHEEKKVQLAADTRVRWAQQQKAKKRVKRDFRLQDTDPRWPYMWYLVGLLFCFSQNMEFNGHIF